MSKKVVLTPAEVILKQFGMTQLKSKMKFPCPRCGHDTMDCVLVMNALSRRENVYVCDQCGTDEALLDWAGVKEDLEDWSIVRSFRK